MASLLVLFMVACAALASGAAGLRVGLTRIHSEPDSFMPRDMQQPARQLASTDVTYVAPTKVNSGSYSYVMTLAIGTPPVSYQLSVDTGSRLMMAMCGGGLLQTLEALPCDSPLRPGICDDDGANPPQAGCTPCTHKTTYGKGWASATLGTETLTFSSTAAAPASVPGIAFGCITDSSGGWGASQGIVGLGRADVSIVSQMGITKFSYCFGPPGDSESTSTLLLGPMAALDDTGAGAVRSTPFVKTSVPSISSYYYLTLTGISVGGKALDIDPDVFALKSDGSGGVIIDSGKTTTSLVDAAYQKVRAEVLKQVGLPEADGKGTGDLCFHLPSSLPAMPAITFHFDGADMDLPVESYMFTGSGLWCLYMDSSTASAGSSLGNYQQQSMHILYDLEAGMLSFVPADCSKV